MPNHCDSDLTITGPADQLGEFPKPEVRWWAVSRRGIEFTRNEDTVVWIWPWRRRTGRLLGDWTWNAWKSDAYMAAFDTLTEYVAFCEGVEDTLRSARGKSGGASSEPTMT